MSVINEQIELEWQLELYDLIEAMLAMGLNALEVYDRIEEVLSYRLRGVAEDE